MYVADTLNGSGFQYSSKVIRVSDMHNSEHVFRIIFGGRSMASKLAVRGLQESERIATHLGGGISSYTFTPG
jgi:hypothetical protein